MSSKEQEILDACDSGTFKYAQQQAQKLLKKYPKSTYYQVLNNYVLLQMGRRDDAISNCQKILDSTTPNDPKSIDLLTEMFESVGMTADAERVYEMAAKKYPTVDTLLAWFHRGCDTANPRIMQKASIALKQLKPSQRIFHLWSGFTCYLAATHGEATALEKSLFPKLGLKIVDSLKPLKNEQEVYVLAKLLELNGLQSRVVEEILSFSKDDKLDLELQILLLKALDNLEQWDELYSWSYKILLDYKLDDFDTWKLLIKSGLKLDKDVSSVIGMFNSRNSQLASVEYDIAKNQDVTDSVIKYLSNFISKPCSFFDVKQYSSHLNKDRILEWLAELEIPKGAKGLTTDLNIQKFKLYFNRELFEDSATTSELIKLYNFYKPLNRSKVKTDPSGTSELILLIVQSWLSQQEMSIESILSSIVILEMAAAEDEHEFHLRLWLIQLYNLINCPSLATQHYDSLNIKNVQKDILGHYLLSRCASFNPSISQLEAAVEIYKSNDYESLYFTKIGFNKGSYNKLEKMLEFQNRLSNSYLKRHLALQGVQMGRILNDKSLSHDYKKVKIVKEYDNRDMSIFWNFGIDEPLKSLETKLLETITDDKYNAAMDSLEAIINGATDTEPLELGSLTEFEAWKIHTITVLNRFLNGGCELGNVKSQYDSVPKVHASPCWKMNHGQITLVDTAKCIQILLTNNAAQLQKKKKKDINDLKEWNAQLLLQLRDDEIGLKRRQEVKAMMSELKATIKGLPLLQELQLDPRDVETVFDMIDRAHLEQIKTLRLL